MRIGIFLILLFLGTSFTHPIHISLTSIDFNETKSSFTIAVKIYKDDFETVINRKYNIDYKVDKDIDESVKASIDKYFSENFIFYIDNKKVESSDLNFLKKETNFEAIWLYYELSNVKDLKKIKIKSSFLNDLYPDQKNLVIFNYKDINKGFKFSKNDEISELSI